MLLALHGVSEQVSGSPQVLTRALPDEAILVFLLRRFYLQQEIRLPESLIQHPILEESEQRLSDAALRLLEQPLLSSDHRSPAVEFSVI